MCQQLPPRCCCCCCSRKVSSAAAATISPSSQPSSGQIRCNWQFRLFSLQIENRISLDSISYQLWSKWNDCTYFNICPQDNIYETTYNCANSCLKIWPFPNNFLDHFLSSRNPSDQLYGWTALTFSHVVPSLWLEGNFQIKVRLQLSSLIFKQLVHALMNINCTDGRKWKHFGPTLKSESVGRTLANGETGRFLSSSTKYFEATENACVSAASLQWH